MEDSAAQHHRSITIVDRCRLESFNAFDGNIEIEVELRLAAFAKSQPGSGTLLRSAGTRVGLSKLVGRGMSNPGTDDASGDQGAASTITTTTVAVSASCIAICEVTAGCKYLWVSPSIKDILGEP